MLELRGGSCYPKDIVGVNAALACVDALIAIVTFYQLIRIHSMNSQLGWTRTKVFHLLIGSSNLGYFFYFGLTPVAACMSWLCWSHSCGFLIMAFPKILLLAAFLLLLSFWVDLCHHSNDEEEDEEDEECSSSEALLEKMNKSDSNVSNRRNCCSFCSIHVGSRQKVVILVILIFTAVLVASSLGIWFLVGKNPIASTLVAQVYVDLTAVAVLLLGGAMACYGLVLFLKMRKVRSERSSSEMWKVAGLAIVCAVCFTSSGSVALATNIPLFYQRREQPIDGAYTSLLLIVYYFIGSSVPSAFILFVMRELPPPPVTKREEESRTFAFLSDGSMTVHPQRWTFSTMVQNQASRASPI